MPGWHEKTKDLQKRGKIQLLGIIEEQHPRRARLFMQWKEMHWPIMVDSLNLLEVSGIPITLLVDEAGVVRSINPSESDLKRFLSQTPSARSDARAASRLDEATGKKAEPAGEAIAALMKEANGRFLWGGRQGLSRSIQLYRQALASDASLGAVHFRLGVAYRARYDSPDREPEDFSKAVTQWQSALDLDPNQYIWRRRIEQYGPRLMKPYPFYDWVPRAREEILARGETPVHLAVEPSGAEFAKPIRQFAEQPSAAKEPDSKGRIFRDHQEFVKVESTVVPPFIRPDQSVRVHVTFIPNSSRKAHWNNESSPFLFWLDLPKEWSVNRRSFEIPNGSEAVSAEVRTVEFEIKAPKTLPKEPLRLCGYALYNVCEDVNGVCLYRRQDVCVEIPTDPSAARPWKQ